ncbi:MAG: DNA-formamidopyrimidine glycosylase family protein [Acidimicrobiales bacterium]
MPELVEVEYYRRLAVLAVGRTVDAVEAPDPRVIRPLGAAALARALGGRRLTGVRRHGKLLLVDTDGPVLGLRFGMTGALLVGGREAVDRLRHSSTTYDDRWVRFRLRLDDGGDVVLHDPRRFGRVLLGPDESVLGPDALSLSLTGLRAALAGRGAGPALKARLQDQRRLAGLGNLLTDEVLHRAGLAPGRPAGSLAPDEVRRLHRQIRATLRQALRDGGSHTGAVVAQRHPGGRCPKDGTELRRARIGGRTTWWCPAHQH